MHILFACLCVCVYVGVVNKCIAVVVKIIEIGENWV